MPKLAPVPLRVLASRIIANVHQDFLKTLITSTDGNVDDMCACRGMSLAMFTADCDDVGYIAVDEATKQADVRVLCARSFYAGAGNATMPWAGEFIGILAGPNPSDASSGLAAAIACYEMDVSFLYADDNDEVIFLAHTIASAGSYLSSQAGVVAGSSLAYLIAPPLEATLGIDAALKAAEVSIAQYYAPPTPTNFSGGLLTGSLSDCRAACSAFSDAVLDVAAMPRERV